MRPRLLIGHAVITVAGVCPLHTIYTEKVSTPVRLYFHKCTKLNHRTHYRDNIMMFLPSTSVFAG